MPPTNESSAMENGDSTTSQKTDTKEVVRITDDEVVKLMSLDDLAEWYSQHYTDNPVIVTQHNPNNGDDYESSIHIEGSMR